MRYLVCSVSARPSHLTDKSVVNLNLREALVKSQLTDDVIVHVERGDVSYLPHLLAKHGPFVDLIPPGFLADMPSGEQVKASIENCSQNKFLASTSVAARSEMRGLDLSSIVPSSSGTNPGNGENVGSRYWGMSVGGHDLFVDDDFWATVSRYADQATADFDFETLKSIFLSKIPVTHQDFDVPQTTHDLYDGITPLYVFVPNGDYGIDVYLAISKNQGSEKRYVILKSSVSDVMLIGSGGAWSEFVPVFDSGIVSYHLSGFNVYQHHGNSVAAYIRYTDGTWDAISLVGSFPSREADLMKRIIAVRKKYSHAQYWTCALPQVNQFGDLDETIVSYIHVATMALWSGYDSLESKLPAGYYDHPVVFTEQKEKLYSFTGVPCFSPGLPFYIYNSMGVIIRRTGDTPSLVLSGAKSLNDGGYCDPIPNWGMGCNYFEGPDASRPLWKIDGVETPAPYMTMNSIQDEGFVIVDGEFRRYSAPVMGSFCIGNTYSNSLRSWSYSPLTTMKGYLDMFEIPLEALPHSAVKWSRDEWLVLTSSMQSGNSYVKLKSSYVIKNSGAVALARCDGFDVNHVLWRMILYKIASEVIQGLVPVFDLNTGDGSLTINFSGGTDVSVLPPIDYNGPMLTSLDDGLVPNRDDSIYPSGDRWSN